MSGESKFSLEEILAEERRARETTQNRPRKSKLHRKDPLKKSQKKLQKRLSP